MGCLYELYPFSDTATKNELEEDLEDLSMLDDDEENDADIEDVDDEVPVSKEGIPLNKEGVCSPAEIKIRSLKEGGRPNPKRLQLITISSPKSSSKEDQLDESDLNLVLGSYDFKFDINNNNFWQIFNH